MYSRSSECEEPPPCSDNPESQQAVAYALPYQKILDAAMFGLRQPCCRPSNRSTEISWPGQKSWLTSTTCQSQGADGRRRRVIHRYYCFFRSGAASICENRSLCPGAVKPRPDRHHTRDQQGAGRQTGQRMARSRALMVTSSPAGSTIPEYSFSGGSIPARTRIFNTRAKKYNPDMDNPHHGARAAAAPIGDQENIPRTSKASSPRPTMRAPRIPSSVIQPCSQTSRAEGISHGRLAVSTGTHYRSIVKADARFTAACGRGNRIVSQCGSDICGQRPC